MSIKGTMGGKDFSVLVIQIELAILINFINEYIYLNFSSADMLRKYILFLVLFQFLTNYFNHNMFDFPLVLLHSNLLMVISIAVATFAFISIFNLLSLHVEYTRSKYNHGHNILRLFDILANFTLTTSQRKHDYDYMVYTAASRVAERLKT